MVRIMNYVLMATLELYVRTVISMAIIIIKVIQKLINMTVQLVQTFKVV